MITIRLLFILCSVFGLSQAFDKEDFLKECHKEPTFFVSFYHEELKSCLICNNVSLTSSDSQQFKTEELYITDAECVVFQGGDVGVVNSDFFKQFPNTKKMTFQNASIYLKSSDILIDNENVEIVGFLSSTVQGNHNSNALHSLPNLRKFVMVGCQLEDQTIDRVLLQKSSRIQDVTLLDVDIVHAPRNEYLSILKSIDEGAFENLQDLKSVYFIVHNMTVLPPKLLKDKTKLTNVHVSGGFEKFPEDLPEQIIALTVAFFNFERVSRKDFERLTKLESLSMYWSNLSVIDEDAFDDLVNLQYLTFNSNQIHNFTARHLKNNRNITSVNLSKNPLGDIDLSELGLVKEKEKHRFIKAKVSKV